MSQLRRRLSPGTARRHVSHDRGAGLLAEIRKHQPGDKIPVTYIRDGQKATADVTLADRPSP